MGTIRGHLPVKLITGFIFKDPDVFTQAQRLLERRYGSIDYRSREYAFQHTSYYEQELGRDLKRVLVSFFRLVSICELPDIKRFTNSIEKKLSQNDRRRINIDPGYLESAKVVLATTKDYTHRIYLEKGIYAEVTLFFREGSYHFWEWTYPDYRSPEYIAIFNEIRTRYIQQIKG